MIGLEGEQGRVLIQNYLGLGVRDFCQTGLTFCMLGAKSDLHFLIFFITSCESWEFHSFR